MLVLEGIHKRAGGELHLGGVDLELAAGSFHVLLGRTLAGKTSLLRIMAGLDRPSAGRVRWKGADVTRTPVRKRSVAMVYQQFVNYPSFTVYENIASPLRLQKARDIDSRVREVAAALHIDHLLERLPGELSGGQQQRVAIARALAKDAELLLFDEPLVNLDYKLREELREELRALLSARGVTVVYATTEPGEALLLGGHTILMHEGRVLQHAPALEVYHRPANATAARLLGDPPMNLLAVDVRADGAHLPGGVVMPLRGHLAGLQPGRHGFGVRAGDCTVRALPAGADAGAGPGASAGPGDGPGDGTVALRGVVELAEISGSETFLYLRLPGQADDEPFIVRRPGVFHHELGQVLSVEIATGRILAFADPDAPGGAGQDHAPGALVAPYR
jgi:glycerol transport system ATP-binding protein